MAKSWIEVDVEIEASVLEAVVNFLVEEGSPGVAQEEISGFRQSIKAYFPHDHTWPARRKRIRSYFRSVCQTGLCSFRSRVIRDEKWAESWKENFRPLRVTPGLVIKPPWESYTPTRGERIIEIDPGMAFGTGSHPTTQICLRFLEETISSFPGCASILDVGTGSGILAIAARILGGKRIVALDIDPLAIENARKNASANDVKRGIDFRNVSPQKLRGQFDMILANLLPQELLPLSPVLPRRLQEWGVLIVSGFLTRQEREIAFAFDAAGMKMAGSRRIKGWAGFVMKKKKR